MKSYDRAYFDRWYRDPGDRVSTTQSLRRKVQMAVCVAEYLLGRPIRTVVDVGCGEAPWFPILRSLRKNARYIGIESSEYALERYGEARNIRRGSLGDLPKMRLPRPVDLVVCADVLQYVETREIEQGLKGIHRVLGGVAYIEAFTTDDSMVGDSDHWHDRSAADYRKLFRHVGLVQCGPYCWTNPYRLSGLNELEVSG
ncbi:MAG TPA: class I SAM-dependent methyltransferase [Gemmatimonadaceae bacterium]|jgi:SAM-dependent methyltransferase